LEEEGAEEGDYFVHSKKKKKHIAGLSGSFISNCYQEQYFVES